jgi:hypothetical protein
MSDALTDIAKDGTRARNHLGYLARVVEYLKNPTIANRREVESAANETDSVTRGYWSGQTDLSSGLGKRLENLGNGDKTEWARLLWRVEPYQRVYDELLELSPFKGKVLLRVDYGADFVNVKREGLDDIIKGANFRTGDCDDYLIAIPEEMLKKIDVTWVRCGISGVKGPRDSKGKPKK